MMAAIFAFTCSCCGKIHEGSPSISFDAPMHYNQLSEEGKSAQAELSSDFCKIEYEDGVDWFVRTILEIPIVGVSEPFMWGVWVSLSQKSFEHYYANYDSPKEGDKYFGWFCNNLPCYETTVALATDVVVRSEGLRPVLILHQGGDDEHQLVRDQCEGISIERAQAIAEHVMHGSTG